jgi:uncharacterized SAM-binding protein YcdF (DUF218 family)
MIFLSKLLPQLVYPLGLTFFLLLFLLVFSKPKRWQRTFLVFATLLIWLGGNQWVAAALTRSLEWQYLPPDDYPQADAIVVLGGATNPPVYPRQIVEVNSAGDRVLYAAHLYHLGKAPYILASGGRLPWSAISDSTPADEMSSLLQLLGVPGNAIWLERESVNTQENAEFSKPILEEHGVKTILLVTSAFHMPRAVGLFEQQGFEVIPAPTDYDVTQADWDLLMHPNWQTLVIGLIPDSGSLNATTSALKEYLGMAVIQLGYSSHP